MSAAAKPQPEEPQRYQVAAACITVRVPNGPGGAVRGQWQLVHLYQNAWLPPGTHPDDIERLLRTLIPGPAGRGGRPMIEPIDPS